VAANLSSQCRQLPTQSAARHQRTDSGPGARPARHGRDAGVLAMKRPARLDAPRRSHLVDEHGNTLTSTADTAPRAAERHGATGRGVTAARFRWNHLAGCAILTVQTPSWPTGCRPRCRTSTCLDAPSNGPELDRLGVLHSWSWGGSRFLLTDDEIGRRDCVLLCRAGDVNRLCCPRARVLGGLTARDWSNEYMQHDGAGSRGRRDSHCALQRQEE